MMSRRQLLLGGSGLVAGVATAYWLGQTLGMDDYNASVAATRAALSQQPSMHEFIRYATLAASGHNSQPWTFRVSDNRIDILPDFTRRTPVVDPDDHHLFCSLGCAAENLALAAAAHGRPGSIVFEPGGSLSFTMDGGPKTIPGLFQAIPFRQSTRSEYDGRPVSSADLQALAEAAKMPGIDLVLLTDRSRMRSIRDLVMAGNHAQMSDGAFIRELKTWLRFSPHQAIRTGDGLFTVTSGNPAMPEWLGPHAFDLAFTAEAENDKYARQIRSSAGIAVFVSQGNDKEHWVQAGRACQRFALQATALGLQHAFINQPVEVAHLRRETSALVGMPERRADLVMRFGYGAALPLSARRPVQAVLA